MVGQASLPQDMAPTDAPLLKVPWLIVRWSSIMVLLEEHVDWLEQQLKRDRQTFIKHNPLVVGRALQLVQLGFVNKPPVCLVVEQELCELGELELVLVRPASGPRRPRGRARGRRKVQKFGKICPRRHLLQPRSTKEVLTPGRTVRVYRGRNLGRRLEPYRSSSRVLERGVCSRGSDAKCGTPGLLILITAVPNTKLCTWGGEDSGGHVL
jgi:hypothetical protein